MFEGTPELEAQLSDSSTIHTKAQVIAEWNLNTFDNIKKIGNYRYRPDIDSPTEANYGIIAPTFDENDILKAYTGATNSDVIIDGKYNENNSPEVFIDKNEKFNMLYSLENCFDRFRPRSGINNILFFINKKINVFNKDMFKRPRYYLGSSTNSFKYWTSYRKEAQNGGLISSDVLEIRMSSVTETIQLVIAKNENINVGDLIKISDDSKINFDFFPGYCDVLTITHSSTTSTITGLFGPSIPSEIQDENLDSAIITKLFSTGLIKGTDFTSINVSRATTEIERGISKIKLVDNTPVNYISDACPFVVYENAIPTNRIIIKMQTNVGDVEVTSFANSTGNFSDPFFGNANKTVPDSWYVEYLNDKNQWTRLPGNTNGLLDVLSASDVNADGYLQLAYGIILPETYLTYNVIYAGELNTIDELPEVAPNGYAYLVKNNTGNDGGKIFIFDDGWPSNETALDAVYGWQVEDDQPTRFTNYVTDLVNPSFYQSGTSISYREFQKIYGLRIVTESMNLPDCTFDLIELSPRLTVDLSDKISSFSVNKGSSDIGQNGIPVSGLLVSNGSMEVFDYDNSFSQYNADSILNILDGSGNVKYNISSRNLQVKFYDVLYDEDGISYHIPIKTLYADGFPEIKSQTREISIRLRDLFFYFESLTAPEMLYSKASLSFVVASLLDSVGFTNYIFKRIDDSNDPIIPNFMVQPNTTIAEVLESISLSTQTAIFFDEYNNLVFMTKEYLLPDRGSRTIDYIFTGSEDSEVSGIVKNSPIANQTIANIVDIASQEDEVYNDGQITYSERNILKDYANINQAYLRDSEKIWKYKAALLWEAAPEDQLKPINDDDGQQSAYTLSAIPLKSELTGTIPTVNKVSITAASYTASTSSIEYTCAQGHGIDTLTDYINIYDLSNSAFNIKDAKVIATTSTSFTISVDNLSKKKLGETNISISNQSGTALVVNNAIMDFGDSVTYISRYNGYFYSNGEIIKYDAVEYSITGVGNVWIKSPQEYREYFSQMSFGGKIFPTGRVRIFVEFNYKNGQLSATDSLVARHGRGQFGTDIVVHPAGISSSWTNLDNQRAFKMKNTFLFNLNAKPPTKKTGFAGEIKLDKQNPYKSVNRGTIKNILSSKVIKESDYTDNVIPDGTIQASALVMTGPAFNDVNDNPIKFLSYTYKRLKKSYNYFGTRLRIIGEPAINGVSTQSPFGQMLYEGIITDNASKTNRSSGSSAGLAAYVDPATNIGYYFEIVALTDNSLLEYNTATPDLFNVFFYKIERAAKQGNYAGNEAIPVVLWAGQYPINVDSGSFTGQTKKTGEELPTVYDIAFQRVDRKDGTESDFYLYINNQIITMVTDTSPIPIWKNTVAPFVRGKTKAMFEHVYALNNKKPKYDVNLTDYWNVNDKDYLPSTVKYGLPPIINNSYLSGIGTEDIPKFDIYYDEFGTIMREMSYFNVKYDKAFPALYAQLMPTFSNFPEYAVSGFIAEPYGAKFMIFNTTDSLLSLSLEGGSTYLRIGGVSFTSKSDNVLTIDDYFEKYGSKSELDNNKLNQYKAYESIKKSRLIYGKKQININADYLQSRGDAENLMGWIVEKMMVPRRSIGLEVFSNPMIQVGDLVQIDYKKDGQDVVASDTDQFVVYYIEYQRSENGPSMTVYLSEAI